MDTKRDVDMLMAYLDAQCQVHGVASAKVLDGEVFLFSAERLERLLDAARASSEKRALVFVKTGPEMKTVVQ